MVAKYTERNEKKIAERCRLVTLRYNFIRRQPENRQHKEEASMLYRKVYIDQDFDKDVYDGRMLIPEPTIYKKLHSCKKCEKKIFERLREFANNVLME